MTKRKVTKQDLIDHPYLIWNTFVEIITMEEEKNLSELQRIGKKVFYYDSQVQNGGHLQYFENTHLDDYSMIVSALRKINALSHAATLERIAFFYLSKNRKEITNISDFVEQALLGEFDDADNTFYALSPTLNDLLEIFVEKNKHEFVEIEVP